MGKSYTLRKKVVLKFSADSIAVLLFIMFYAMPFLLWGFENIMGLVGLESVGRIIYLFFMYFTCIFLCIMHKKYIIPDFVALLFGIVLFFALTYLMHPEYNYVYTREYYGVWPYVLRPDNGIYAYLFVRLLKEPQKLMKGLRISSFLMMGYSALLLFFALRRGYWVGENYLGQPVHLSYDLNFGYNLLLPVCTFLLSGLKNKNIKDLVIAAVGIMMIFIGGSRGPFLGITIFGVLYVLMTTSESKYKIRKTLLLLIIGGFVFVYYRPLLTFVGNALESFGISSRTITKLLEGSISEDNGRSLIWLNAVNHIRENPFGSGAMGARNALYKIHYVGHPHNFFLEILIDYGVILGPILIVVMLIGSLRLMFAKKYSDWHWVYLLFFAQACSLLSSYTYWHSNGVWGALAVAVCAHRTYKKTLQTSKKR